MSNFKVLRTLKSCLTVGELIAELQNFHEDTKVLVTCDYGDHCHTTQALPIESIDEMDADHEYLEDSAYSHSGVALHEWDDDRDECEVPEDKRVTDDIVVLRVG